VLNTRIMVKSLSVTLFSALSLAYGATHYITPSGAGNKSGSDWLNAYQGIPSTLKRGDTYVLAGGTYGAYRFDDATSGSTYIYIRKAQSGTYDGVAYNDDLVAGWSSSYESTQVLFTSSTSDPVLYFNTGYWSIDGVTPSRLWSTSGYGIKVTSTASGNTECIWMHNGPVTLKHMEVPNRGSSYDTQQFNVFIETSNVTVSHNYIYNGGNLVRINGYSGGGGTSGNVVEYNVFGNTWYSSTNHSETIGMKYYDANITNTTIRYNYFKHSDNGQTTGFIIDLGDPGQTNDGVYIYGNVFTDLTGHNGIGSGNSGAPGTLTNWKIYNNTFIRSTVDFSRLSTGSELVNNVFYSSDAEVFAGSAPATRRNNYWNASTNGLGSGSNDVTSSESTSVLFAGYASNNFDLGSGGHARNTGYALTSPYNLDPDGTIRGADSAWDIGAYEYSGGASTSVAPPAPQLSVSAVR
jgi:hypothetical protein